MKETPLMDHSRLSTRLCVAFIFMFIVSSLSTLMAQAAWSSPAAENPKAGAQLRALRRGGRGTKVFAGSKPMRASAVSSRTITGQPSALDEGDAGTDKIVFQRGYDATASLLLLDLWSGAETPLGSGSTPAFSPDNSQIAFERNGEIMLMNADGSNQHSLATPAVGQ